MGRRCHLYGQEKPGDFHTVRSLSVRQRAETYLIHIISYLTQIADQVVALISDNDCRNLVWSDDDSMTVDEDGSDRLFNFQVSKTNEQDENVAMVPGFKVCGVQR
jgi:hypothetical protein